MYEGQRIIMSCWVPNTLEKKWPLMNKDDVSFCLVKIESLLWCTNNAVHSRLSKWEE